MNNNKTPNRMGEHMAKKNDKKKAPKRKQLKGEKVVKMIEFDLTDEEKSANGMEAAQLARDLADAELEKSERNKIMNANIKTLEAQRDTLLDQIHKGTEERETEVVEFKNFERGKVEYWLDNEIVKERDVTEEDKQLKLSEENAKQTKTRAKAAAKEKPAAADELDKKSPEERERAREIAAVHREETSQLGSRSALNGPKATLEANP